MRQRFQVPLTRAEKERKYENAEFLNDYLRRGLFKAKKDSRFVEDSFKVQIDYDKTTPTKLVVRGHSDPIDAVLYAFKESYAYREEPELPRHKPGTSDWYKQQEQLMEEAAMSASKSREEGDLDDMFSNFGELPEF